MKPLSLSNLSVGDRIVAIVEELISGQELIVGYQGHLLRVKNSSGIKFQKGDQLDLVIYKKEPLELRLFSKEIFGPKPFDRFG